MAEIKVGTTVSRFDLSPILAIFRLFPEEGHQFPRYKAGQYIALRRENCRLTRRILQSDGRALYVPDLDEHGNQKRGPVTHSYSISSAPYETEEFGWLEFYIILEMIADGKPGRLTESLFQLDTEDDNTIVYYTKTAGDFTLERRAMEFENVVFIGTGTGLAPFASMIKQLHHEGKKGPLAGKRYTLFHGNRGSKELGYHKQLAEIERSGILDFVYIPTVSRPSAEEYRDPHLGKGRANNVLRSIFDLPMKEEENLVRAHETGENPEKAEAILHRAVRPVLPAHVSKKQLLNRMAPDKSVILTCGNPRLMQDILHIAAVRGIRCEKEEW
ncbi:MAG: hypothetical protein HY563_08665 [Ignavibacteriales bacterium]|nr:hypothetical protein [Ignavibacteriales bacterium]